MGSGNDEHGLAFWLNCLNLAEGSASARTYHAYSSYIAAGFVNTINLLIV